MDHEVITALGVAITAIIGSLSAILISRNTQRTAAKKKELDDLAAAHTEEMARIARQSARKVEVAELKRRIAELERELASSKRRVACLEKIIRGRKDE